MVWFYIPRTVVLGPAPGAPWLNMADMRHLGGYRVDKTFPRQRELSRTWNAVCDPYNVHAGINDGWA